MSYALESMLRIRGLREDRAQVALVAARTAQMAAERDLEARRNDRETFEETKEERRDRLFEAVIGRKVRMDDLDRVRAAVTRIDEKGVLLAEAVRKATVTVEKKTALTESARADLAVATRNKAKIEEHKAIWEEESRLEQEWISDAEMDEFAEIRRRNDDDDSFG